MDTVDVVSALSFEDVLADHGRHRADHVVVVDAGVRLTYRELAGRVAALAAALDARGFAGGDRLVWLGGDSHRLLECLLAAARLGGVFCPVSARQPRAVLDAILDDCSPAVVIGDGRHDHDEYESALRARLGGPPVAEAVRPDAPLLLLYTMLGRRAVGMQVPRATVLHEAVDIGLRRRGGPDARGPLHHLGPLVGALAAILTGTTVVVSASLRAPRTLLEL